MTAKVDLRTGKIIGCKEGSFEWFHEKGHLAFADSDVGVNTRFLQEYSHLAMNYFTVITLGSIVFSAKAPIIISMIFAILLMVLNLGSIIYEEHWCNKYARKEIGNKNRKTTRRWKW